MIRNRLRNQFICAAMAAAVGMLSVAGCTSSLPSTPVDYTPPAWMAERHAVQEKANMKFTSCMAEAGYDVDMNIDGSFSGRDPAGISETESRNRAEAQSAAGYSCSLQVQDVYGALAPLDDDEKYRRITELAECLRFNGYPDIGHPPIKDVWIESQHQNPSDIWSPYKELYKLHSDISEDSWYRLQEVCVQDVVVYSPDFRKPPEGLGK